MFEGWILLILSNASCFWEFGTSSANQCEVFRKVDTAYTRRYEMFLNGRYCLYQVIRSYWEGQYLWYAVFLGIWYSFNKSTRNISKRWILPILGDTKYFRPVNIFNIEQCTIFGGIKTSYTKRYAEYSGIDTLYTRRYAIFPRGGYCLYKGICNIFKGWILLIFSNSSIAVRSLLFLWIDR